MIIGSGKFGMQDAVALAAGFGVSAAVLPSRALLSGLLLIRP